MKVLVVDDEPMVRRFVCAMLKLNSYDTVEAQDGEEALKLAAQHQCDVVITDCLMPKMSGPQLVAQLKERHYPASYLLISAYKPEKEGSDLPLLPKPFTVMPLLDAIERLKHGAPGLTELKREADQARAQWLKSIEEQEEILFDVPTQIPGPDGALLLEKAGFKRKAAYRKYVDALHKYQFL